MLVFQHIFQAELKFVLGGSKTLSTATVALPSLEECRIFLSLLLLHFTVKTVHLELACLINISDTLRSWSLLSCCYLLIFVTPLFS